MNAREALRRFLWQSLGDGGSELFLDKMTAAEALRLLAPPAAAGTAPGIVGRSRAEGAQAPASRGSLLAALAEHAPGVLGSGRQGGAPVAEGEAAAPERAGKGTALTVLAEEAAGCTRCRLHETRQQVVFGDGNPRARVVVVGEAPGREEDRTGRPFVGAAGKLLDLLLLSAGFPREEVYICNVIKCRPPENRNPMPDEVEACASYLHGQLAAIEPTVLLALGKFAAQTLVGSEESIGSLRGRVQSYRGLPLVVTYHPAYLLRSPNAARDAWRDFQLLRKVHDSSSTGNTA